MRERIAKTPFSAVQTKKPKKHTIKRILQYMGRYKWQVGFVMVCILISSVASVASAMYIGNIIDNYIEPVLIQNVGLNVSGMITTMIGFGAVMLIGALCSLFYNRIMASVSQRILKQIRDDMFTHMQSLPVRYFDEHTHGDIMSYYTNDTDTLRQMLSQSIPSLFSSLVTLIAVVCAMIIISVWLTLAVFAFVFIMLFVIKKFASKSGRYFIDQQKSVADVNGYIEEMVNGQRVIKVFNHEAKAKQIFDEKNELLCYNMTNAHTYSTILMPIMNSFGYFLYVLIAIVGGLMAISGVPNLTITGINVLSLGNIATFLTLSRSFINPIAQVSQQMNSIIMALAGAERIFEHIDESVENDDGFIRLVNVKAEDGKFEETREHTEHWAWKIPSEDGGVTYVPMKGEVIFKDVVFGYNEDKTVLHDVSLYAKPGQKIAFVGATGAGKTTITNLINRFYDISSGSITYDGIDIKDICKYDLRQSLGIVLQDVNLFTGTVMDNIRYGKLDATDEECIAAAKLSNAHNFIEMLPDGYNTMLEGNGEGLSQGQRQLLSIARAAVLNPPVMILDEATSSIDTRTEKLVQDGMDALMRGRTVFVIAHRLSTVQNSNAIIVLENGKIIERGDHDQLLEQKGKYYELYTGAFELE